MEEGSGRALREAALSPSATEPVPVSALPGNDQPRVWQPIATAPKDGSEFIGYHLSGDRYTGDWFALVSYSGDPEWPWHDAEGNHPECFLTHWLALPEPPPSTNGE